MTDETIKTKTKTEYSSDGDSVKKETQTEQKTTVEKPEKEVTVTTVED